MILYLLSVVLCTGLFTSIEGVSNGNVIEDSTSLIAEFVQNFMKPYIEAHSGKVESPYQKGFQISSYQQSAPENKSTYSSSIKSAIKDVVDDLQPYLQDDEHDYHKYLENDETTIIEFLPKSERHRSPSSLQENLPNIYRYEKMKSDIKQALEKENVSDKTKLMVTKTLDELIAQVLSNKCNSRSGNDSFVLRSSQPGITSKEWDDMKTQYLKFLNRKQENSSRALHVFNDFHYFFSKVINETQSMSGRSRFKCQVINDGPTYEKRSIDACFDFKVCSTELKDFLQRIYDSFNETVVNVFTNYAAMYIKDVSAGEHGDTVSDVLQKAAKVVEQRVAKVYTRELPKFQLDQNRTQIGNIRFLRSHVKYTMKHLLKYLNKNMHTDLAPIKTKLLEIIQKDIRKNLNVELGNQETELKQSICTVFMTCNGRVTGNRRSLSGNRGVRMINPKSIYVKLKISVDDKQSDDVSQLARGSKNTTKNHEKHTFRVTRTTVANNLSNYHINLVK